MLDATPLLRAYAAHRRRRLAALRPGPTQERTLLSLVRKAAQTRFGRDHGFEAIRSVADFQKAVPLRRHQEFWAEYWSGDFPNLENVTWPGRVPYFAVTSGTTTGTSKYIPCTVEMNRSNRKAALDVLTHHVTARPQSRVMGGRSFLLGGSTDLVKLAPGVCSGDLSGIAALSADWWARPWMYPPLDLALISDWEAKIEKLAETSRHEDIRMFGGTPSWVLIFADRIAERCGVPLDHGHPRIADIWPNLELVIHGGVNFAPYKAQFDTLLEGSRAEAREVYPASEGFIASADRSYGEGMRLNLDVGLFMEFVPVEELDSANPTRHWVGTAEPGVNYAIVLSTCAGIWAYPVGDTVKFVDLDPPRILVTGRTSYMLSAFGEHLIGEEIEEAVATAASEAGARIADYSVGPVYPRERGELGWHLYIMEFVEGTEPADVGALAARIDRLLLETNDDYSHHRADGFGMRAPEVRVVPPGFFTEWMRKRGRLGGQNKVPRIVTSPELFEELRSAAGG